ncbi:O-antigen ligase family protein [Sinomonas sp. G460-2]|uniref:O-antigen ligase family protein n=1 Tax=Sinomonas sp. G460-2 TaxID=3393464 RepID=UPI0039F05A8C
MTQTHPGTSILLKLTLAAILIFPPNLVFSPLGASGSLPEILALGLFVVWLMEAFLGLRHSAWSSHPGRTAVLVFVFASCLSYASLFLGFSGLSTSLARAGADRWMLLMVAIMGIVFITSETVRDLDDVMSLARWVLAGGAVCAVVAVIQFATHTNPVDLLKALMPGFVENSEASSFQARNALMRVAGTTLHPIELGVVSSMLLPLAVWRALYDRTGSRTIHWGIAVVLLVANALTVSRSAMLALAVAIAVMVPALPPIPRKWALVTVPVVGAGLFVTVPGLVSAMFNSVADSSSDSSITWRLDDYPRAESLVAQKPLLGGGPGTYMHLSMKDNFDNQYLLIAVTMGLVGLLAFAVYVSVPGLAALGVARWTSDPSLRLLAATAGAAGIITAVSSATFDSMSFQVFALLYPFFIGISGVVGRLHRSDGRGSGVARTALNPSKFIPTAIH